MSIGDTHIIHQQTIDVSLTSDHNATDIQEQLKELLHTRSMPVIEKVLDQVAGKDEHIYIERLEVDMGTLNPSTATHDMLNLLRNRLEVALHELLTTSRVYPNNTMPTENRIGEKNGVLRHTPAQAIKSAFFTYLAQGILPAKFHHYTIQQLEQEMIEQEILEENVVTELADLSRPYPHIVKRIIYQFSPAFIEKLLSVHRKFYAMYESSGVSSFHRWILQKEIDEYVPIPVSHKLFRLFSGQLLIMLFDHPGITKQDTIKNLLDTLRKESWFPSDHNEKEQWIRAVQAFLGKHNDIAGNPAANFSWQLLRTLRVPENTQRVLYKASEQEQAFPDTEEHEKTTNDQHDNSIPENKDQLKETVDTSFSKEYMKSLFNEPEQSKQVEPYYINNAGLVLLTPYLEMFFKETGLLDEKQFPDTTAKTKAIYLLHELAWGDVPASEPDLVFNKILCGMPVEMPLLPGNILTDKEKAACEELLNAVVRNWGALKNTSPQGLREAFLQRNGKLVINESNMQLTVEKNAMDVLLNKLPWSYNIVKQPWMKHIIFVDWTPS